MMIQELLSYYAVFFIVDSVTSIGPGEALYSLWVFSVNILWF